MAFETQKVPRTTEFAKALVVVKVASEEMKDAKLSKVCKLIKRIETWLHVLVPLSAKPRAARMQSLESVLQQVNDLIYMESIGGKGIRV